MAGDWIKMRVDLLTHPKVVRIASALRADRLRTVGGLMSVWCLFDAHSTDGSLEGYTLEAVDELIGWPGFAAAMKGVGWLEMSDPDGLRLPEFDTHNGASAKRRAQEADRKRREREEAKAGDPHPPDVPDPSAPDADKRRTREEERRDKEIRDTAPAALVAGVAANDPPPSAAKVPYRTPDCPYTEIVNLYQRALPSLSQPVQLSPARRSAIQARWRDICAEGHKDKDAGLEWFAWYFGHVAKSDFLMGRAAGRHSTGKVFRADLEFLMTQGSFLKVVEGKYHEDAPRKAHA